MERSASLRCFVQGAAASVVLHVAAVGGVYLLASTMGSFAVGDNAGSVVEPIEISLSESTPTNPEPPRPPEPEPAPVKPTVAPLPRADQSEFAAMTQAPPQPAAPAQQSESAAPPTTAGGAIAGNMGQRAPILNPRERDSYVATLMAWLNRHKQYPTEARRERVQGIAVVRFTIDTDGRVLASSITRSSGHQILDDAALAVFVRANPVPSVPKSVVQGPITLAVPIEFSLITR